VSGDFEVGTTVGSEDSNVSLHTGLIFTVIITSVFPLSVRCALERDLTKFSARPLPDIVQ